MRLNCSPDTDALAIVERSLKMKINIQAVREYLEEERIDSHRRLEDSLHRNEQIVFAAQQNDEIGEWILANLQETLKLAPQYIQHTDDKFDAAQRGIDSLEGVLHGKKLSSIQPELLNTNEHVRDDEMVAITRIVHIATLQSAAVLNLIQGEQEALIEARSKIHDMLQVPRRGL